LLRTVQSVEENFHQLQEQNPPATLTVPPATRTSLLIMKMNGVEIYEDHPTGVSPATRTSLLIM
jgi:hypothetical protein